MSNLNKGTFLLILNLSVCLPLATEGDQFSLVVANQGNDTVSRFSEAGEFSGNFAHPTSPGWIHSDSSGSVFVSGTGGFFSKYSASGSLAFTVTTPFQPGDIVTGSDGTIYVADYFGSAIYRYSSLGTELGMFVDLPSQRSDFLARDASGDLYSGSFRDGTVRRISSSGVDLGDFVSGFTPYPAGSITGIAFDSKGQFYVANEYENRVHRFAADGSNLGVFVSTGLNAPYGLAFDGDDNLYVSNYGNDTIRKFASDGTDLGYFATTQMSLPRDLAFIAEVPELRSTVMICGLLLGGVCAVRFITRPIKHCTPTN